MTRKKSIAKAAKKMTGAVLPKVFITTPNEHGEFPIAGRMDGWMDDAIHRRVLTHAKTLTISHSLDSLNYYRYPHGSRQQGCWTVWK